MSFRVGLRTQLVALVLAVALPALGFGALAVWQLGHSYRDEAEAGLRESAQTIASALNRDIQAAIGALNALAASPLIDRGDLEGFRRQAATVGGAFHGTVALATPDGRLLLDTGGFAPDGRLAASPALARALQERQPVLADAPDTGDFGARFTAALFVPVLRDGTTTHVLRLRIGPQRLADILRSLPVPEDAQVAVTDAAGVVIAHAGRTPPALGAPQGFLPGDAPSLTEGTDLIKGRLPDGARAMVGRAPLGRGGWGVQVAVPRDRFDGAWRQPLERMAFAALLLVLVAAGAALTLGRSLSVPLRALADQADALLAGTEGPPPLPPQRTAELEQVRVALLEAGHAGQQRAEAERRAAEAEAEAAGILAAEAQFHALVDRMPQIVWTAAPDGRTVYLNRRWYDFSGFPPGIAGEHRHAALHPADASRTAEAWTTAIETGETFTIEHRYRSAAGHWHWFLSRAEPLRGGDGRIQRWFGTSTDISELVAAREAAARTEAHLEELVAERTAQLGESEARLRGVFDAQFQFIGLISPEGILLSANRTALDYIGAEEADVAGRPLWDAPWWPEDDITRRHLQAAIAEAAAGQFLRYEAEIRDAEGQRAVIDFTLKPVRDPRSGAVKLLIQEGRDVTENRLLQRRLAEAEKLEALGQLAGGVAHDFNNVLQAVLGGARLIGKRPGDAAGAARLAAMVADAAERGANITRRLLAFARRDELRARAVAPRPLLEGIADVLTHTIGPNIAVRLDVPPDPPALIADPGQLETVLVNLAVNARDAMPSGGALVLAAAAESFGAEAPAGLAPGAYLRLSVSDTGHGMDAATLAHAMEPFFTTKPPGKGTGLGLSMARGFAEQSGGGLSIASTPGQGTCVSLWLPRDAALQAPPPEEAGRADALPAGGNLPRLLLVDDEPTLREILAQELTERGALVETADCGEAALARLSDAEPPEVLVTDVAMPGMDGVALLAAARAAHPGLPALLVTGHAHEATLAALVELRRSGPTALLRKPVGVERVLKEAMRLRDAAHPRNAAAE
ncbi:MAG TPA: PAS domain-containing protein [Roseomonas sp.]